MGFQVHTREVDRVVVVEAVGRLTLTDGHTRLRDLIHVSTGSGIKKFILNLARVEFIDSYGIGELVRSYSVVRQAGGEMKLSGVSQRVPPFKHSVSAPDIEWRHAVSSTRGESSLVVLLHAWARGCVVCPAAVPAIPFR
jgi:anti-sigma B factor antagonist